MYCALGSPDGSGVYMTSLPFIGYAKLVSVLEKCQRCSVSTGG